MKIFLTNHFRERADERGLADKESLPEILNWLGYYFEGGLKGRRDFHRVHGVSEDIYVVEYKESKIFFTMKNEDFYLLSVVGKHEPQ